VAPPDTDIKPRKSTPLLPCPVLERAGVWACKFPGTERIRGMSALNLLAERESARIASLKGSNIKRAA
jgi:hypothetical protein